VGEFETLANPAVGLMAHMGQVDVRITAAAPTQAEAEALIAPVEAQIRERLGEFIYGEGDETVEGVVGKQLAARGMTVAVAEAGARGQLVARIAALPEAAQVFAGGETIPDSADLSQEAARVRAERKAHWGVAVRVAAPPEGARIEIALTDGHQPETRSLGYGGHPASAPLWASTAALNLLRLKLLH